MRIYRANSAVQRRMHATCKRIRDLESPGFSHAGCWRCAFTPARIVQFNGRFCRLTHRRWIAPGCSRCSKKLLDVSNITQVHRLI